MHAFCGRFQIYLFFAIFVSLFIIYTSRQLNFSCLIFCRMSFGEHVLVVTHEQFHFSFDSLTRSSLWLWLGHNYGTCKSAAAVIALAELASWVHSRSSQTASPLPLPQFFLRCPCSGLHASSLFSLWRCKRICIRCFHLVWAWSRGTCFQLACGNQLLFYAENMAKDSVHLLCLTPQCVNIGVFMEYGHA